MITLRPHDVVVDPIEAQRLQEEFQVRHCVLLQHLLDPSLLDLLQPRLREGRWTSLEHVGIGTEVILNDDYALNVLHFAINAPAFLDVIKFISGRDEITWFDGRIFRMDPKSGHYDSWHDDMLQGRLVGMSINLSFDGYEGGEFELRDRDSTVTLARIANLVLGNASLFRINPDLQHRVGPLRGTRPRTAFAGWFKCGSPDLLRRLRGERDTEDSGHRD